MTSTFFSRQKSSQTEGLQEIFFFVLFWHLQILYSHYVGISKCSEKNNKFPKPEVQGKIISAYEV